MQQGEGRASAGLFAATREVGRGHAQGGSKVGHPGEMIAKTADSGKFDLVIMGSHGRTALSSVLLGSVANKVLSQSTVPVLIVR